MNEIEEALEELKIPCDARAYDKFRAVCQWELGYPSWAATIFSWLHDCGYEVKEARKQEKG